MLAGTSALVRLGAADQGTQPLEQTSRRAYDLLAEGFGPGFNGPIPIVVDVNGDKQAPQRIYDGVQGLEGRRLRAASRSSTTTKTVAIVFVTPTSAPQDEATDELVDRLRDDVVPAATAGGDAVAYVSGQTAAFKDIADQIIEPDAGLPALHHRRHVPRAGDGVPVDRDLRSPRRSRRSSPRSSASACSASSCSRATCSA